MGFNDILKSLFGNKSDRDMKELMPIVAKVNAEWEKLKSISADELRAVAEDMKKEVREYIGEEENEIAALKRKVEEERPAIEEREEIYDRIDKLEEQIDKKVEEVLTGLMPKAFAVMKETARRFKENTEIEVTATQFDRDLAVTHDFVEIEGDKAIYFNSWLAGGNEVTWDMVHYDVQLIGGAVLHQGKIAEMATGEGKTLVATLPVFLNALSGRGVHMVTVNDYLAKRDSEWMGPLYMFHGLSVDCIDKHQPNSPQRRQAYMADITFGTNNEFGFDYLRDNMAINPEDLVQRKHNFAIVDEVDSVLIDDARTPLIISGPVPKGDDQMFDEYKPRVERLVKMQQEFVMQTFKEAKELLASDDSKKRKEGGILLLRAHKGLPKYKPLIKFLSEEGNKAILIKTENEYMQENNRRMPEITDPLYFVIDEKLNSIDLTDKGHDTITAAGEDPKFFILPDIGSEIAEIERDTKDDKEKLAKKDELIQNYAMKSERVHTVNQLLKAYTLFEKDVEYVVLDNKVKIVDEQTGRIMEGRRYSDGLHQAIEAKENVKVEAATQTFATITLQNYFRMYHKLAGMTGTAETEAGEFWDIYKLDVVVIPTNRPVIRIDANDFVFKTKREKYNAVIDEIVRLVDLGRPVLVGTTSVEVSELLSRMLKLRGIKHNVLNAKLHQREAEIVAEAGKSKTVTIATNMAGRGTDIKLSPEVREAGGLAIIGTERHDSRRVDRQLRGRAGRQGDPGESRFYISLEDNLMRLFAQETLMNTFNKLGVGENDQIEHKLLSNAIETAQKKIETNNYGIRCHLLEYDQVMNEQREIMYAERRRVLDGESMRSSIMKMITDFVEGVVNRCVSDDKSADEWNYDEINELLLPTIPVEPVVYDENVKNKNELTHVLKEKAVKLYEDKEAMFPEPETIREIERVVLLKVIDRKWMDHIDDMDQLKQGIGLQAYGQKDPVVQYKMMGYDMFDEMTQAITEDTVRLLMHIQVEEKVEREQVAKVTGTNKDEGPSVKGPVKRTDKKIYPNDLCPCGSGKKYKNCCGRKA